LRKSVERDLQIATAISSWRWQATAREVYLEGRQDQSRHGQAAISLFAEFDEPGLVVVPQM
jgi:hypothetical protein